MVEIICSVNRESYLYHGRANAIRPYHNGINRSIPHFIVLVSIVDYIPTVDATIE
jgi:hypothetical protein